MFTQLAHQSSQQSLTDLLAAQSLSVDFDASQGASQGLITANPAALGVDQEDV